MATSNPIQWPNQNPRSEDEPNDHEIIRASRQVDERFLAALVRRIVAVSGATRVILFGSRARNEERDDSDVDLFVIVPGQAEERDVKRRAISRALFERRIPLDIIVRTEDDVRRATSLGDPFIVDDILREGRVLYAG
ncbi:MAG: nucleotidyltransferase domain-containing protein [Blastocatellia bacterium]